MEALKKELMQVIRKYFPAADNEYDMTLEQQGTRMIFKANVPVHQEVR